MSNSSTSRSINRVLSHALTVEELIDALECYPKDAKVVFTSNYGDICNTRQVLPLSDVDDLEGLGCTLEDSAYSDSGVAMAEIEYDEDGFEADDNCLDCEVVVLG